HWVDHRTHHIIAVSQAARRAAIERGQATELRITCIPNGIPQPQVSSLKSHSDLRRELGIAQDAPLILCAARLEKEKDISTLVAAMPKVLARVPSARCLVAGEGTEHQMLTEGIARLGLTERVRLLGFRPDALSLMNAADL